MGCHDDGMYHCAGCGRGAVGSDTKFDSGHRLAEISGKPAVADAVRCIGDRGHLMVAPKFGRPQLPW